MDTVTHACALRPRPGKGRSPKPKRAWCSAPTGTFTQSTCGPARYAMLPRAPAGGAAWPASQARRPAAASPPGRDPTHLPGSQPLLQEQNRPPRLPAGKPAGQQASTAAGQTHAAVEPPPAQQPARRILPPPAHRHLLPEPARHRQPRLWGGCIHPARLRTPPRRRHLQQSTLAPPGGPAPRDALPGKLLRLSAARSGRKPLRPPTRLVEQPADKAGATGVGNIQILASSTGPGATGRARIRAVGIPPGTAGKSGLEYVEILASQQAQVQQPAQAPAQAAQPAQPPPPRPAQAQPAPGSSAASKVQNQLRRRPERAIRRNLKRPGAQAAEASHTSAAGTAAPGAAHNPEQRLARQDRSLPGMCNLARRRPRACEPAPAQTGSGPASQPLLTTCSPARPATTDSRGSQAGCASAFPTPQAGSTSATPDLADRLPRDLQPSQHSRQTAF